MKLICIFNFKIAGLQFFLLYLGQSPCLKLQNNMFSTKNDSSSFGTKKTILFANSVYRKVSLLTQIKISPD